MSDNQPQKEVESKKVSKLTMEKKRRARINASLKEIRNLLRDSGKLDEFQYSRMEKAEVLEAAVLYLREQRYHKDQLLNLRRRGYGACADSILCRLETVYSIEDPIYQRVKKFLQDRWTMGQLSSQFTNSANEMSVFTANQERSCSSASNVVSSTKNSTIPLYANNNAASTVAPSNSVSIQSLNYIHPSIPTVNTIWRPW